MSGNRGFSVETALKQALSGLLTIVETLSGCEGGGEESLMEV